MLHAAELRLTVDAEPLVSADPPPEFQSVMGRLR